MWYVQCLKGKSVINGEEEAITSNCFFFSMDRPTEMVGRSIGTACHGVNNLENSPFASSLYEEKGSRFPDKPT